MVKIRNGDELYTCSVFAVNRMLIKVNSILTSVVYQLLHLYCKFRYVCFLYICMCFRLAITQVISMERLDTVC